MSEKMHLPYSQHIKTILNSSSILDSMICNVMIAQQAFLVSQIINNAALHDNFQLP